MNIDNYEEFNIQIFLEKLFDNNVNYLNGSNIQKEKYSILKYFLLNYMIIFNGSNKVTFKEKIK